MATARSHPKALAGAAHAAVASPFPPIGSYGFLSDCHTGALVAADGTIEWLCVPRFDAPSVFGALLDRGAGTYRLGPYGTSVPVGRRYEPGTNILETTWMTSSGWLIVREALTIGGWHPDEETPHTRPPSDHEAEHMLVRHISCIQGEVTIELICEPSFDYGSEPAEWTLQEGDVYYARAPHEVAPLHLYSDLRLGIEGDRVRARHTLAEGESCFATLTWDDDVAPPASAQDAVERLDATSHYWRAWLAGGSFPDHPWRGALQRSALTLKGLTYGPTGATVAALTTSLPETPGGERNWDYRFTWMRDASFTLWALHALGLDWEADDFMQFVADLERNEDGSLQIMYGVAGERDLTERTIEHLTGYEGSVPVRAGNAAFTQRQNDVFGAVLDSVYLHTKSSGYIPARLWPVLEAQVESATAAWREPDQGIWETRGPPRHYVSSKLMCWVALDRGTRLAELRGDPELAARWQKTADEIRADVLERGVSEHKVFRQHYDTDALDASSLLALLFRFLPADDERIRATVRAIARDLTQHGLVLRYRVDETEDGLRGEEGTFLICSFWLVSALAEIGEKDRARHLCERLLSFASPLGLYAEELDADSGRHLGNFPQAFTHLALINAVLHVAGEVASPFAATGASASP
jgi:GH15 family glucan-1,4-alpha-glucosidase